MFLPLSLSLAITIPCVPVSQCTTSVLRLLYQTEPCLLSNMGWSLSSLGALLEVPLTLLQSHSMQASPELLSWRASGGLEVLSLTSDSQHVDLRGHAGGTPIGRESHTGEGHPSHATEMEEETPSAHHCYAWQLSAACHRLLALAERGRNRRSWLYPCLPMQPEPISPDTV